MCDLHEAVRLFGVYTAGRFQLWGLAGSAKAGCRAHIMSALVGSRVPQSKSGINALRDALYPALGVVGNCEAARVSDLGEKCRAMLATDAA